MNHKLWHMLRPDLLATAGTDERPMTPPVALQLAAAQDQAYAHAHPELYAYDTRAFSYDRSPLPGEWSEDSPCDSYVRIFVINAWTIVRVLHTATGQRLQAPVMEALPRAVVPA